MGEVAGELDGAAWLGFTLAFAIAAASAASYAELVTRFPGSAGSALYAQEAFGREGLTFVVGMAVMLSSLATAATTTRAFAGDYLAEFVELPVVAVSLGVLVVLTAVSIRGIELSAKVNVGMTLIEIGGLVLVLVIGGAAILDGGGDAGRITDFSSVGPDALLTATALAFFAFLGFEDAVHLSEEVPDVRRVFPRVLFGAVVIASVLYLSVVLVADDDRGSGRPRRLRWPASRGGLHRAVGDLHPLVRAGGARRRHQHIAVRPRRCIAPRVRHGD